MKTLSKAPIIAEGSHALSDIQTSMDDAMLVCPTGRKGERWFLTRGGQFVRTMNAERYHVVPDGKARGELDGAIEDERFEGLFPEWTDHDQEEAARFGWGLAFGDYRSLLIVPVTTRNSAFAGPEGEGRAQARVEKAARRTWDIGAQEAHISSRALEAIRIRDALQPGGE